MSPSCDNRDRMHSNPILRQGLRLCTVFLALSFLASTAAAQAVATPDSWDPRSLELTRPDLEALQARYQEVVASPAYSGALKDQAKAELTRIQERLKLGDFRTGDRITLHIQGEEGIPDTLFVEPGPAVTLPRIGPISLGGVLRSELQEHMTQEISRFITDPVVEARSLVRVSVLGAVGRPGFYVVPADLLLGDVIMMAGGPSQNADLSRLSVRRGNQQLLSGAALQEATVEGRSLDQLNLRAGDALMVPVRKTSNIWGKLGRYALLIGSTLFLGRRIF